MTRKTQGPAKRKRKPISQAEQSRRFIEAAREAEVDTSDEALERIVRKIAKRKSTESFTGLTVAEAERKLIVWRKAHPSATIVTENMTQGTGLKGTESAGKRMTTIHIEFTE